MLRHKSIDRICCIVMAAVLLLSCGLVGAAATGLIAGERSLGYEDRLFDQSRVHTLDIVMDDWEGFLRTCTSEEYAVCTAVIDGENVGSVGIRGKGNTSLSSVQSYGNDRYSFKVEFDHYQNGKTYHGLDKLSLNNLIQDKTYMKDYLAYTLMNKMGVAAPLCSFVQISVNGEPWGLYLAVEGVEDSFLLRSYASSSGELYKPDSMSFGGGRGNGREFDMEAFSEQMGENITEIDPARRGGFDPREARGGMGSRGSADVMLQYTDDDPSSYSNIFDNAKTDVSEADMQRLIESLKALSEGEEIETVVDTDAVIRYLTVHNFLCNDDSYTGMMVHNYYLYEEDGVLSMIPWDYNLAFGAFSMGGRGMSSGAASAVNSPIDSPVSSGEISSRPMISWIFENEAYVQRYHELYAEFIGMISADGWLAQEIERVSGLIAPYVEEETRAFFTYDEFVAGVDTLQAFCEKRAQSVAGQLDGTIPSTTEAQRSGSGALIDASDIDLNAMGEFGMGGDGGKSFGQRGMGGRQADVSEAPAAAEMPQGMMPPEMGEAPGRMMPGQGGMGEIPAAGIPQGMTPPEMGGIPGQMMPGQSENTASEWAEEQSGTPAEPVDSLRQAESPGIPARNAGSGFGLLVGCAVLQAAAVLFAKFYKTGRS